MKLSKCDTYGITEYKLWVKLLLAFAMLYTYIAIMAIPLYLSEVGVGNIKSYEDAFWLLQMSVSTIGFGDFYPVTTTGRWIIVPSFYIGMTLVGFVGASLSQAMVGFTDKSIQNRELRQQNAKIIALLKQKETKCLKEHQKKSTCTLQQKG